jgi:hypothetical protein
LYIVSKCSSFIIKFMKTLFYRKGLIAARK